MGKLIELIFSKDEEGLLQDLRDARHVGYERFRGNYYKAKPELEKFVKAIEESDDIDNLDFASFCSLIQDVGFFYGDAKEGNESKIMTEINEDLMSMFDDLYGDYYD